MFHCLLTAFVASLLVSALLTRYIRNLAVVQGWVCRPVPGRHIHSNSVPRLGGVAIFVTVISMVAADLLTQKRLGLSQMLSVGMALGILAPASLIFLVGLYDDLRSLGPYAKLAVQVLGALLLYANGFGIRQFDLFFGGRYPKTILGLPLTILWVLLITNAFNLIDGLDGLAAGSALFSTLVVFVMSLLATDRFVSFLAVALAGAILGFLRFNFNPATIFLGDSGSLFMGFMLSALALAGSQKAPTMVAVAIPVVSFGLPILDVAVAVVRRFLSGKPLFKADGEHIHHKLIKRGLSQREAVLLLYGVSALFGLLSLALLHGGELIALVLVVVGVGACIGIQQLRYHELTEIRCVVQRTLSQKRVIANDLNIRRATDSLRTCEDVRELCRILADTLRPIGFDGFSFKLPFTAWFPDSFSAPLSRDPSGALVCCWTADDSLRPAWELKLELISSAGGKCGFFAVYKRLTGGPLLVDINLLTDGFHAALADAVHRLIIKTGVAVREYEQVESSLKVRAASASSSD